MTKSPKRVLIKPVVQNRFVCLHLLFHQVSYKGAICCLNVGSQLLEFVLCDQQHTLLPPKKNPHCSRPVKGNVMKRSIALMLVRLACEI